MSKILFYNKDKLCTEIIYTKETKSISIVNYTDDLIFRAFGINENPSWTDLENFLRSRCFPEERMNRKHLLELLGVDYYDPWLITKKTEGRMEEDHQWLKFVED